MHRGAHAVFDGTKSIRAVFSHKAVGVNGGGLGNAKQTQKASYCIRLYIKSL